MSSATVDLGAGTISIAGSNFTDKGAPTVSLGGTPLTVKSASAANIVALLGSMTTPGTYSLVVTDKNVSAPFDVTVGAVGPQGAQGAVGSQGPQGVPGPVGLTGAQGPAGPIGPAGPQGVPGTKGDTGATGAQGPIGPIGPQGATGAAGTQGPVGPTGATGAAGPVGPIGATGAAGPMGPSGPTGPAGPQGPAGLSSMVRDANGNVLGTLFGFNSSDGTITILNSGYFINVKFDGTFTPSQIWWVHSPYPNSCSGTGYLGSSTKGAPTYYRNVVWSGATDQWYGLAGAATNGIITSVNPAVVHSAEIPGSAEGSFSCTTDEPEYGWSGWELTPFNPQATLGWPAFSSCSVVSGPDTDGSTGATITAARTVQVSCLAGPLQLP